MEKIISRLNKNTFKRFGAELVGAALFALAFNWLILPLNLYSGNLTGVAQIISDLVNMFILAFCRLVRHLQSNQLLSQLFYLQ